MVPLLVPTDIPVISPAKMLPPLLFVVSDKEERVPADTVPLLVSMVESMIAPASGSPGIPASNVPLFVPMLTLLAVPLFGVAIWLIRELAKTMPVVLLVVIVIEEMEPANTPPLLVPMVLLFSVPRTRIPLPAVMVPDTLSDWRS